MRFACSAAALRTYSRPLVRIVLVVAYGSLVSNGLSTTRGLSSARQGVAHHALPLPTLPGRLLIAGLFAASPRHSSARNPASFPPTRLIESGHRFFGTVSRGFAQVVEQRRQPMGPAQRLYPRRGGRRRLHRRRCATAKACSTPRSRRPAGLLAGPLARLRCRRRRRPRP